MAEDFGYAWRTVRLYCPSAPTFLAREWVQAAWKQLLAARRWGFMRATITLGTGSTATNRPRTIMAARLGIMRLAATRLAYAGATFSETPSYPGDTVLSHLLLPADFGSFVVVADQTRQLRIPFRYSLQDIVNADPGLTASGPTTALIATTPDPATGQPRYLLYPSGTATTLTIVYNRQAPRLVDGYQFTGVLADGAEVLVAGALAQAALWPGTGEKPNPMFNAGLAQTKLAEFKTGIQMLSLRDDEQYPDDLWDYFDEADCGCLGHGADPRTTDASYSSYY